VIHPRLRVLSGPALASMLLLAACGGDDHKANQAALPDEAGDDQGRIAWVDNDRLLNADSDPGDWMSHGRTYSEQRFSPLDEINDGNTNRLGLAWYYDLDTARGQEATPIVVDGVMYVVTAWSHVVALNAATGQEIWYYDPQVPGQKGFDGCCDVVSRGVAVWKGKVFVATFDGRLIALDARTGKPQWTVKTVPDDSAYTITGAPRVVKDMVVIGNAGAENAVRGYVSAYDTESGDMKWRFYLVPGDPSKPDNAASDQVLKEIAAPTWSGEYWQAGGGGGTAWDSIVYDPETDLLFIGAGNGGPFDRNVRSPGGGDNLFLGSIVALRPETGEYVWHFQETPGDSWDFTSVQQMIVANLEIDGQKRHVIMHAPKNGFFYVIDAKTGEFISGENYAPVNWATGLDENGRPIMNPDAWYMDTGKPFLSYPGPAGAHNWNPMSYSPVTGLVYIPVQDTPFVYAAGRQTEGTRTGAIDVNAKHQEFPEIPDWEGRLVAWDPVKQEEAWRQPHPLPFNGGTLATAGNLVFQGTTDGMFYAYRADTGEELWKWDMQSAVMAGPVSYTVNGEQYVAVTVGLGGGGALVSSATVQRDGPQKNISRVVAVKLDGGAMLPAIAPDRRLLHPPALQGNAASVARGATLYGQYCARCHGQNAQGNGVLPDLRYSTYLNNFSWYDIVVRGSMQRTGMVSFGNMITRDDATAIRDYVTAEANKAKDAMADGAAPGPDR